MADREQRVKGKKFGGLFLERNLRSTKTRETVKAATAAVDKIQTEKDICTESYPPAGKVDHDYIARITKAQEEDMVIWEELKKKRDMTGISFARRDDPVYADFYAPFDPEEAFKQQSN